MAEDILVSSKLPVGEYRLEMKTVVHDKGVFDSSDSTFNITSPSPYIIVLFPQEGELLQLKSTYAVQFCLNKSPEDVLGGGVGGSSHVYLLDEKRATIGVIFKDASSGIVLCEGSGGSFFLWEVGARLDFPASELQPGNYKLRVDFVSPEGQVLASGVSDLFKIVPQVVSLAAEPKSIVSGDITTFIITSQGADHLEFSLKCPPSVSAPSIEGELCNITQTFSPAVTSYAVQFTNSGFGKEEVAATVVAYDASNNFLGLANASIVVVPKITSSITVLAPNGGEIWAIESIQTINWKGGNSADSIGITLLPAPGESLASFDIAKVGNTSALEWAIPSFISPGNYIMRVCTLTGENDCTIIDTSDAAFSIVAGTADYKLSAVYVSGNKSNYTAGEKISLVIKGVELFDGSAGEPSEGFNVQSYLKGVSDSYNLQGGNATYNSQAGYWEVKLVAPNDTSRTYIVDSALYCSNSSLACGKRYAGKSIQVNITFNFQVSGTGNQPLMVVSPNGGETHQIGQPTQVPIKWTADCGPIVFLVGLIKGNNLNQIIKDSVPAVACSSGQTAVPYSTDWSIPSSLAPGSDYKIWIYGSGGSNEYFGNGFSGDDSDAPFSIIDAEPTSPPVPVEPFVTVLYPNGGEAWHPGETQPIKWNSTGVNFVKIYIYDSNMLGSGSTNYITPNNEPVPASQGYFNWTIGPFGTVNGAPGSGGNNYRIRIDNADDPSNPNPLINDSSDAPFSITVIALGGGGGGGSGDGEPLPTDEPAVPVEVSQTP